ncbi:MAG TPA: ABC transporter permease [Vicinamibacterales bacterium]|nr:ABC transporter permease [Vicinamibacterales bacterium]
MLHGTFRDLQRALRSLRSTPGLTIAAIVTLTLGIGATSAVFSVANGLILRPLPVRNPAALQTVTSETALRLGFQAGAGWSYAMWEQLRRRADAFDGAFAWILQRMDLSEGGEMQPVDAVIASGDVFATLGVPALVGRTFTAADDVAGGGFEGPVAVISHSLWQRRFAGSVGVLGSRLLVERVPVTVVGVAPEWFRGLDVGQPFDIAMPFGTEALVRGRRSLTRNERALLLTIMLRLKPGQTASDATAALRAMQGQIVRPGAPEFLQEPFRVVDASRGISDRSGLRQRYRFPLLILAIVSAIVLVTVCLNLANLLLSRAAARTLEIGVRMALGAPRWRLARQYLVEALALGIAGAAGGLLFGRWASRLLVTQLPFSDRSPSIDLSIDWRVLAFSLGLSLTAVLIFGTVPAYFAARVAPMQALQGGRRQPRTSQTGRVSGGLVVAQVALSIVLLAGAGLFVRTATRLAHAPLGFDPTNMLVVSVNRGASDLRPGDPAQRDQRILEAVLAVPGVVQAAGSVWNPIGTGGGGLVTDARGRRSDVRRQVAYNFVTPGWFDTYGIAIRDGRDFDRSEGPSAPRVAVINEALRRSVLGESQPLGTSVGAGPCGDAGCTIVGIVADTVYGRSPRDAAPPAVYMPLAQSGGLARPDAPLRISVRAAGDLSGLVPHLASALRAVDHGLTFGFTRLEDDLDAALAQERLLALLAGFFGAVALLLSGVGLYGVSSYAAVSRRTEIGVRLALGAQPGAVVRSLLGRIAFLVSAGTVLGLSASLWLERFVRPLLYGLQPGDPLTLIAAISTLAIVAAAAVWIPASRAARLDPARVLRPGPL